MTTVSWTRTTRLRTVALCGLTAAGALGLGVAGAAEGDATSHARHGNAVAELRWSCATAPPA